MKVLTLIIIIAVIISLNCGKKTNHHHNHGALFKNLKNKFDVKEHYKKLPLGAKFFNKKHYNHHPNGKVITLVDDEDEYTKFILKNRATTPTVSDKFSEIEGSSEGPRKEWEDRKENEVDFTGSGSGSGSGSIETIEHLPDITKEKEYEGSGSDSGFGKFPNEVLVDEKMKNRHLSNKDFVFA